MKNEFRIGNFIKINNPTYRESQVGHICRINEIREDGLNLTDVDMSSRPTFGQLWKFIEPIKLTEEWLLKFGAKKLDNKEELDNHYHFGLIGSSALYVCIDNGNNFANEGKALYLIHGAPYGSFPCKYVHQLQNLYFAITGKELIIL